LDGAGGVNVAGNAAEVDVTTTGAVDVNGAGITIDASSGLSMDAAAASNLTTSAGALTLDGAGGVNVAGNAAEVDVTTTGAVDVNGAGITIDASSGLSMDAAAASNLTTSAGALTLDGAGGVNISGNAAEVDVTTTGTVDLNASTLDVDATTITVDATTTTFTGKVEGPNATANNQFATYYQLDSLANRAPFIEFLRYYKLYNGGSFAAQSVSTGGARRVSLTDLGIFTEESEPVASPAVPGDYPYSLQFETVAGTDDYLLVADPGIYEVTLTMELANPNAADAFVNVSIVNYDALEVVLPSTTRTLVTESEVVYGTAHAAFANKSSHVNLSMIFEADNSNERIYLEATPYVVGVEIRTFGFAISRVGEQ